MNKAQLAALIERLIESCGDEEDMDVCGRCIDELVEAGKAAVPTLVDLLADWDEWVDVRLAAVEALGRIGGRPAIKALETALEKDPHTDVQGAAAQALGRLKSDRSIALLLKALDTADRDKQVATTMALAHLRNPAAVPRLEELADQFDAVGENAVAGTTRAAVVYISEGVSGLESIVDDKGQGMELRRGATVILREAHHLDALPILVRCLRDEELRSAASQSWSGVYSRR
jgi:HEAT repeat protein